MNWLKIDPKLSCWFYRRQSVAFIEESLAPVPRSAMLKHLTGCPECREEVRSLQGIIKSVRRSAPPPPPLDADLWPKIEGRLQGVRPTPNPRMIWGLPAASLASLAVAAAAYMSLGGPGHRSAIFHPGDRGGTVIAQAPAGAMSPDSHPEDAPALRPLAAFRSRNRTLASLPSKGRGEPASSSVFRDSGPVRMAPSVPDETTFAASAGLKRQFRTTTGPSRVQSGGDLSPGGSVNSDGLDELAVTNFDKPGGDTDSSESGRSRKRAVGPRLDLRTDGTARRMKYSFGRKVTFGLEENVATFDEQRNLRDTPLAKRGANQRVAGSGRQSMQVMTLASLSPEVLTAVNGAFLAGDGMRTLQVGGPSSGQLFNRSGQLWSIDANSHLPLNHVSPQLPSTRTDGNAVPREQGMAPAAPALSEGAQYVALAESTPNSFFSQVQTVDSLGRPAVTNRITGQADPEGTVRFTASESRAKVGDQP